MKEVIKEWKVLIECLRRIQSCEKKNGGNNRIDMRKVRLKLKKDGTAEVILKHSKKIRKKIEKRLN